MGLKLGFYYHVPARKIDGQIAMPGYQGVFVDSLAEQCEKITCFLYSPSTTDTFYGDYKIRSANVELVELGPHATVPQTMFHSKRYVKTMKTRQDELDVLLLRGPSPLLPALAHAAGKLPLALLLVGDYLAGTDGLPQPLWRKELIRLWSRWNYSKQLKIAKRSLTFVNSHKLHKQLEPHVARLVETRTTTLNYSDFYYRKDTCQKPPYHLLYTGRIDRTKGLMDIVLALKILNDKGYECILDLVGNEVNSDPILTEIRSKTENLDLSERVIYHGYRPLGPQLFDFYRKSDIYIIASQTSEGFPRTIWEAMANSLPVVATRVGSIPDFVEGAAVLVQPRDIKQIATAIIQIIQNPEKRRALIQEGILHAKENTLEKRTHEIIININTYINKIPR